MWIFKATLKYHNATSALREFNDAQVTVGPTTIVHLNKTCPDYNCVIELTKRVMESSAYWFAIEVSRE